jgi:hypothetical protein
VPGIKLFHEGQFEGSKVRLPVFLRRRPVETADLDLQMFYRKLLETIHRRVFHEGQWKLCDRTGWPDNPSFQNLLAWTWLLDNERYLIVVNLSDRRAQGRVQVPWADAAGGNWRLIDALSGVAYERDRNEMQSPGLYVELRPWNYHLFQCLLTKGV